MGVKHMYSVYWVRPCQKIKKYHGSFNTVEDAMQSIKDWWDKHDFRPSYYQLTDYGDSVTIDYGQHNCFYEIKEGL